jgi:hypothetical protein
MKEFKKELISFGKWMFSSILSSTFLILWVYLQSRVEVIANEFTPSGIDKWQLIIFQVLFAVSTIIPIATYIIKMLLEAWRSILEDLNT